MIFLVTGATGRVGRYLVEQLHEAGHQVRALTRNPQAQFPQGVEIVVGDLMQPSSLASALEGVTGLHLITFGGDDYAPLQTGDEIIAMAEQAGVKRVTVLTGGQTSALEKAVQASSLAWTMLQPVEFMTGALDYAESIRAEGVVKQPFADRKTAIVHEADIAAVAVVALTEEGHGSKAYWITGPEVLTPRDLVQTIGENLGRDIPFVELSVEEANKQWIAAGTPQDIIDFMMWAYGNTPVEGKTVSPSVQIVTGQPGRTFAHWAAEHVDQFRSPSS